MAQVGIETAPREVWATALPTSGVFRVGDRVNITNPGAGGVGRYVCTTSGTAGVDAVFKAETTVAA